MSNAILQIDFNAPKWPRLKGHIQQLKDNYNVLVFCRKATMGYGDEPYPEIDDFINECTKAGVIYALYAWPDVTAPVADQIARIDKLNKTFDPYWWGMDFEQWWNNWNLMEQYWGNQIPISKVPAASRSTLAAFGKAYASGMTGVLHGKMLVFYSNGSFVYYYCPAAVNDWIKNLPLWDAIYPDTTTRWFSIGADVRAAVARLPVHVASIKECGSWLAWQFVSTWGFKETNDLYDVSLIPDQSYARMTYGIPIPTPVIPPDPIPVPGVIGVYVLFKQYSWPCITYIRNKPDNSGGVVGSQLSRGLNLQLIPITGYDNVNGWIQIDPLLNKWIWGGNLTKIS